MAENPPRRPLISLIGPCHILPPPPPQKKKLRRGNKTEGSNIIMSTSLALIFWSNKVIHVDIILSITLIVI